MRTSSVIEVPPKDILNADFKGVIPNEVLSYGINLFARRFMNISEDLSDINSYLKLLENKKYHLHEDDKIFNAKKFKDNNLILTKVNIKEKQKNYPHNISNWSISKLKSFRTDMFRLNDKELKRKYNSSTERINYLKSHVRSELKKRKRKG